MGFFSLEGEKESQFIVIAIMQVISGIRLSCRCSTMLNLTINGNTMVSFITQWNCVYPVIVLPEVFLFNLHFSYLLTDSHMIVSHPLCCVCSCGCAGQHWSSGDSEGDCRSSGSFQIHYGGSRPWSLWAPVRKIANRKETEVHSLMKQSEGLMWINQVTLVGLVTSELWISRVSWIKPVENQCKAAVTHRESPVCVVFIKA